MGAEDATGSASLEETTAGAPADLLDRLGRVGEWVRDHQVAAFFVLAYAWTWAIEGTLWLTVGSDPGPLRWLPVGVWGPVLSAAVVTWASGGSLREWAGQVTVWRVHPLYWVAALSLPLVVMEELATVVYALAGVELLAFPIAPWKYVVFFLFVLVLAGGTEELGWRGFAQPRLQERYSALTSALVVGTAWTFWHLPNFVLFDYSGYSAFPKYIVILLAHSVFLAWLYNCTGSVLLPMVMHAAGNLAGVFEPVGPVPESLSWVGLFVLAVYVGLAGAVVLYYGHDRLAPDDRTLSVPGRRDRTRTEEGTEATGS